MSDKILMEIRNSIGDEAYRQAWDAFMVPLDHMAIPEQKREEYGRRAKERAFQIEWRDYNTIRLSFVDSSIELLSWYAPLTLAGDDRKKILNQMYVRFMEGRVYLFEYLEKMEAYPGKPSEPGANDFHNRDMAMMFTHMPYNADIANYLIEVESFWEYEQLHMVTWFAGQLSLGRGYYSRKRPNHSAKITYQRLLNPYSLLWIAAALGEDREVVLKAGRSLKGQKSFMIMSNMVRKEIPWNRIYEISQKKY